MTTTTVDLSPLLQVAVTALSTLVPALVAYLVYIMRQRQGIEQAAADAALVDRAASRAGGIAYAASQSPNSSRNEAVAIGVAHLEQTIPAAMARLNVVPAAQARMVSGELGKLEAAAPVSPLAGP